MNTLFLLLNIIKKRSINQSLVTPYIPMAGASYLFFLTVLLFFRGTIGVDDSINFINLLENYQFSLHGSVFQKIAVDQVLGFRVGNTLERDPYTKPSLDIQFYTPGESVSALRTMLHFSEKSFAISRSGEERLGQETEYIGKEMEGFIVNVEVNNGATNCEVKCTVTLYCAGDGVQGITRVIRGPYSFDVGYVIKEVTVSTDDFYQIFLDDRTKFVESPSVHKLEPMRTLDIIKLEDEDLKKNFILGAFPEPRHDRDPVLNIQLYNNTKEEVVKDSSFFNLTLNGTELFIRGSTIQDTKLDLNGKSPDGILVQISFSNRSVQYVVSAYKYGECIGTSTGEMKNGGGNRIILNNRSFIYSSDLVTSALPELQSSIQTVLAFNAMGLSGTPDLKRYIMFDGQFSLGYILRRVPGMACSVLLSFELRRPVEDTFENFARNRTNLNITFNGTRIVADPSSMEQRPTKTTGLDMSGMDGFTVEFNMGKEISYTVTPYSGGKSFNGKRLQGVLEGITTPDYNRLLVEMIHSGTVFYPLGIQYGDNKYSTK